MDYVEIKLRDVQPNPYRKVGKYKLQAKRVKALVESINQTGFWNNVIGRITEDGEFQIAYGHHRLEAAKQALGPNYIHSFPVADLSDYKMLQMMSAENSEDWGNTTEHDNLTVEEARDMLDEWFDDIKVIGDDGKLDRNATLDNLANLPDCPHGIGYEEAVKWFGGGSVEGAKNQLAKLVKASAGRGVIAAFMGMKQTTVRYALENIGLSSKEAVVAQEAAEKARERQREAEKAAREAKKIADTKAREAAEKRVQADLKAAEQAEADALSELEDDGYIDRKAVELFGKPIHAKAFRQAAVKAARTGRLKVEDQRGLAQSIISKLGEGGLSARAIEDHVIGSLRKVKKAEYTGDMADYAELLNNIARYGSSLRSSLDRLCEIIKEHGITEMRGPEAKKMQIELCRTMTGTMNVYGQMGMFPPTLDWNKQPDGSIRFLTKDGENEPFYNHSQLWDLFEIDIDDYEEVA